MFRIHILILILASYGVDHWSKPTYKRSPKRPVSEQRVEKPTPFGDCEQLPNQKLLGG